MIRCKAIKYTHLQYKHPTGYRLHRALTRKMELDTNLQLNITL